jgi:hypothetical protein
MNGRLPVREDQEAAMDCELAREQLDAARPDIPEREEAELRAAFAHLDECPACAEVYEFRRAFDRRVSSVIRQVEIPSDLRSRLSATVAAAADSIHPAGTERLAVDNRHGLRASRRAGLLAASAAALLMTAGWTWVVTHRPPAPLRAATVLDWWQQRLGQPESFSVTSLPEFDGRFEPVVADGRWQSRLIGPPRGADIDEDGQHDFAVFEIKDGFLVVLAPGRVSDPPSATSALAENRSYAPAPHVAWTQGGSMHICFLPGASSGQLERLLKQVNRAA